MAEKKKNLTQTLSPAAQQTFERLVRDMEVPRSNVLEKILSAIDSADLIALMQGRLSLTGAKTCVLDAETVKAIRAEVASAHALLGPRLVEAARLAAAQGVAAALRDEA